MNFKRYVESSDSWVDSHYIMGTDTNTLSQLPTTIYPNDTSITVGIKGNTIQNGTPNPDTPIMPQGTGERTGNLLPEFYATSGEIRGNSYTITKNSIEMHNDGSVLGAYYVLSEFKRYGNYANYTPIDEKHSFKIPTGTYTFSGNENIYSHDNGLRLIVGQLGRAVSGASAGAINVGVGQTFTINADSYVCPVLEIRYDSRVDEYILTNPMLNLGSEALPYEPYGYKIPILMGSTTNNVYLGEVQTVRQIKKLVLDGTESWTFFEGVNIWQFYIGDVGLGGVAKSSALSNIVPYGATPDDRQYYEYGCYLVTGGSGVAFQMRGAKDTFTDVTAWKTYLQQQYAAGTPVCVWYVLATEETAVVNEPLMKIGTYADSLTTSIPCTAGENTLDVQTTVQPSEVTISYKGWHPVSSAHERSGGAWD